MQQWRKAFVLFMVRCTTLIATAYMSAGSHDFEAWKSTEIDSWILYQSLILNEFEGYFKINLYVNL